jgi:hypothetical protein
MPAFAVMETLAHLESVAALLRQAAEAAPGPFHERRLLRLAIGFERLTQPIQRIASGLDHTADEPSQDTPHDTVDPAEGLS